MIKASEFRLGNLIESDGEVFAIDSITEDVIHAGALGINKLGFFEDYGIPLTPEWLLKFGLEKDRNDWILQPFPNQIPAIRLYNPSDNLFLCDKTGTIIKTVHSLQNYFFCLYGRELQLKK